MTDQLKVVLNGMITETFKKGLSFMARQDKSYRINLARVSMQNFFTNLTKQYQSKYIVSLGANPLQLGIVNGIGGLAGGLIAVPTGWLADKYGIKRILLSGIPLMALGALIFALSTNWTMTILATLIFTLALRMVMTVCPMVCGTCLKKVERAMGMQLCDTLSAVPNLIAPMIAALIITEFGGMDERGIRPLYFIQALGLILVLTFTLTKFRNPQRKEHSKSVSSFMGDIRQVFMKGLMVKRFILFTCLSTIPFFVDPVYIPLFATTVKGADQFIIGGLATTSFVAPLLLSIVIGKLADTIGRKKVIYLTTCLYALSTLLLLYAPDSNTILVSGFFQGFWMLGAVTRAAMTAELVPVSLLGSWYGILNLFRGVTAVVAPFICGIIWSLIGPAYVFLLIICTQLMSLLILSTLPETLKIIPLT